jgi:hypothetical protein
MMAKDTKTMELGLRWRKSRRAMKAAAKKAGMEWQDFLAVVDRVGLPGRDNQNLWIDQAKQAAGTVLEFPQSTVRAIDWQALIAALMPLIEKLIAMCVVA